MSVREVNLRLDKIRPKSQTDLTNARQIKNYKASISIKKWNLGNTVSINNFSRPNRKGWKSCIIDEFVGSNNYICKNDFSNKYYKRHVNQIIKGGTFLYYIKEFNTTTDNILKEQISQMKIQQFLQIYHLEEKIFSRNDSLSVALSIH